MKRNYYRVLGLTPDNPDQSQHISIEDITQAYHKAALVHHPDKGGNEENFKYYGQQKELIADLSRTTRFADSTPVGMPKAFAGYQPDRVNVTSLIRNAQVSVKSLLEYATTNLNFAQALMSANGVLVMFTLQQQYELLFCLIEQGVTKKDLLAQDNPQRLIQAFTKDQRAASASSCQLALSTRLICYTGDPAVYYWILEMLPDDEIRKIALSHRKNLPLIKFCLQQWGQIFDLFDLVQLRSCFQLLWDFPQEGLSPTQKTQLAHYDSVSIIREGQSLRNFMENLLTTNQQPPICIVHLARSFPKDWRQCVLMSVLFQTYSAEELAEVRASERAFIENTIVDVVRRWGNEKNHYRNREKMLQKEVDAKKAAPSKVAKIKEEMAADLAAVVSEEVLFNMISFVVESERITKRSWLTRIILETDSLWFNIDEYTERCQEQWLQLFFPSTNGKSSRETIELFVSLIQTKPINFLHDFFSRNKSIFTQFIAEFKKLLVLYDYDNGEDILKRIIPMVNKLGLKDYFLKLFPDSKDYYEKFEWVKKWTETKRDKRITASQFGDIDEVLRYFQEDWLEVRFSEPSQALSLLPTVLDYFTMKLSQPQKQEVRTMAVLKFRCWLEYLLSHCDEQSVYEAIVRSSKIKCCRNLFVELLDSRNPYTYCQALLTGLSSSESGREWIKKYLPASQLSQIETYEDDIVNERVKQYQSLTDWLDGLLYRRSEGTVYTEHSLTQLSEWLTAVIVDKTVLDKLNESLERFPTLLLAILDKIESGEIPSHGQLEWTQLRQQALAKNPRPPELVFLSCAKQVLYQNSHQIDDRLLEMYKKWGANIEPTIRASGLYEKLSMKQRLAQIATQSQQDAKFSLAEVDYKQQFEGIIHQLTQWAVSLPSAADGRNCTGMPRLYQQLLELKSDELTASQQSLSQALCHYFPHPQSTNLICWMLQVAWEQQGSEFTNDIILGWLERPSFITTLMEDSAFDEIMLTVMSRSLSPPSMVTLRQKFIQAVIENERVSASLGQRILSSSENLTAFIHHLTEHLTIESPAPPLAMNKWSRVYTQLLSMIADSGNMDSRLLPILIGGFIQVMTFIVQHERFSEIQPSDSAALMAQWINTRTATIVDQRLHKDISQAIYAMDLLFSLMHNKKATNSFKQGLLSGLISLAARQNDFPDVIHDFVIQRLIQMNLLPDLLPKIESLFGNDEQEAQRLLDYLAARSVKLIETEAKESASQLEEQTSLLGCMREEAYVNADDVIIQQYQRLREKQLTHQSTPYLDRLLGLLDSYLYRSMDWNDEWRIQHLGIISALLKQLPNTTSTISKECVQLLQKNIIKERMSLQVHHASGEAFPIPMMDDRDLLPLRLRVNHWHDCLSDTQKKRVLSREHDAESLEQHYHYHFQDFLHLKSYVDLKCYQDWHLQFIAHKGDYDSALYRLNQLLHQYVQTYSSLDVSTRRTQIKQLLQFVLACGSLNDLNPLPHFYDDLKRQIEVEYDFVYRHLAHRQPVNSLNLDIAQIHSTPLLEQRKWYQKLWSRIRRFLNREHVKLARANASRQPVKYALVDEADGCQQLLELNQLNDAHWQRLLTFYQQAWMVDESMGVENIQHIGQVAEAICQRLVGKDPRHQSMRQQLAENFDKVKPIFIQLLREHEPFREAIKTMIGSIKPQVGGEAAWPPLTRELCRLYNQEIIEKTTLTILKFLPDPVKISLQSVSKRWQQRMTKTPELWAHLDEKSPEGFTARVQALPELLQQAILQQHCGLQTAETIAQHIEPSSLACCSQLAIRALERKLITMDQLTTMSEAQLKKQFQAEVQHWDLPKFVLIKKSALSNINAVSIGNPHLYSVNDFLSSIANDYPVQKHNYASVYTRTLLFAGSQVECKVKGGRECRYQPASMDAPYVLTGVNMFVFFGCEYESHLSVQHSLVKLKAKRLNSPGSQADEYQLYQLQYDSVGRINIRVIDDNLPLEQVDTHWVYSMDAMRSMAKKFLPAVLAAHSKQCEKIATMAPAALSDAKDELPVGATPSGCVI